MLIFTKKHINVSKEGQTSESVWHLLMNVKNNYLFTKPLKWANKKYKKFENKNDIFKKKIWKNIWRYYFTSVYKKSWSYDLQFLRYRVWQTEIDIYGSFFAVLTPHPLKNQKNNNFENMIKTAGDIIILHMCTKSPNHTRYSSWDTTWYRQNFLLGYFLPF